MARIEVARIRPVSRKIRIETILRLESRDRGSQNSVAEKSRLDLRWQEEKSLKECELRCLGGLEEA